MTQLNEGIKKSLINGDLLKLLNPAHVEEVQFGEPPPKKDAFGLTYQIYLQSSFPKERGELVCLFPNHRKKQNLSIDCSTYKFPYTLASFNKDINAAFSESLENTVMSHKIKFAIAFGEHVYACKDITGTIYIVWASCINTINPSKVCKKIAIDHPLVLNFDGNGKPKGMYLLKQRIQSAGGNELKLLPLTQRNPILIMPWDEIFVCESSPKRPPRRTIKTISESRATELTSVDRYDSEEWMRYETNMFECTLDLEGSEEELDNDILDNLVLHMKPCTPRRKGVYTIDKECEVSSSDEDIIDISEPDPFQEIKL